jgi:hypothetical protein
MRPIRSSGDDAVAQWSCWRSSSPLRIGSTGWRERIWYWLEGYGARQEGFGNDRNRRQRHLGGEIAVREAALAVLRWRFIPIVRVLDLCPMVGVSVIMRVVLGGMVIMGDPMTMVAERSVKREMHDRKQLETNEPEHTRRQGAPPGLDLSDAPGSHERRKLSRFDAAINHEITQL